MTKLMKLGRVGIVSMLFVCVTACVTINIYFPAAAAEKAADKIIDEIWQLNDGSNAKVKQAPNKDKEGAE